MVRARYRLRNYKITPAKTMMPAHQAVCVTGEDADCGADSGDKACAADVERWIAEHTRDTGHGFYRLAQWDYVQTEPGAWQ